MSNAAGVYLASVGLGLQNGIVSIYSGAITRPTHATGILTDLGIYIGHSLRGLPVDMPRLQACIVVVLTFALGSAAGALLCQRWQGRTSLVPAVLTGLTGLGCTIYRQYVSEATGGAGTA